MRYEFAQCIVVSLEGVPRLSRWWEARTIWGRIVNETRNLARQVCRTIVTAYVDGTMQSRAVIMGLTVDICVLACA